MGGEYAASLYMLTTTLRRPRSYALAPLYASIGFQQGEGEGISFARSIFINVQPHTSLRDNSVFREIMSKLDTHMRERLLSEIKRDLELASMLGLEDALKRIRKPIILRARERQELYSIVEEFIRRVIGSMVDFSVSSKLFFRIDQSSYCLMKPRASIA